MTNSSNRSSGLRDVCLSFDTYCQLPSRKVPSPPAVCDRACALAVCDRACTLTVYDRAACRLCVTEAMPQPCVTEPASLPAVDTVSLSSSCQTGQKGNLCTAPWPSEKSSVLSCASQPSVFLQTTYLYPLPIFLLGCVFLLDLELCT